MAFLIICLSYKRRKLLYKAVRGLSGLSGALATISLLAVLYSFLRHSFILNVLHITLFDMLYYNLTLLGVLMLMLSAACWKLNRNTTFQPLHLTLRRSHIVWCVLMVLALVNLGIQKPLLRFLVKSMESEVGPRYKHGTSRYMETREWQAAVDRIQRFLQCCGVESYTDWYTSTWIPISALNTDPSLYSRVMKPNGKLLVPLVPSSCCRSEGGECGHQGWMTQTNRSWSDMKAVDPSLIYTKGCKAAIWRTIYTDVLIFQILNYVSDVVMLLMLTCTRFLYSSTFNSAMLGQPRGKAPGWLLGPDIGFTNWRSKNLEDYAQGCIEDEESLVDAPERPRKKGIKACMANIRRRCKRTKEPHSDATGASESTHSKFRLRSPCIDKLKQKISERRNKKKKRHDEAKREVETDISEGRSDVSRYDNGAERRKSEAENYKLEIDKSASLRGSKVQKKMSGNLVDVEGKQTTAFGTPSEVKVYEYGEDTHQTSPFVRQTKDQNGEESTKQKRVTFSNQPSPRSEGGGTGPQTSILKKHSSKSEKVRDFQQTRNLFENASKIDKPIQNKGNKTDPRLKKYRFPSVDLIDFNDPVPNKPDDVPSNSSQPSEESYPIILRNYVIPKS
uniref:Tetraspanin n=1 Tax=Cuerna arida TaxID=1464854 RepID=A0A1B6FX53_9HEMI